MSINRGGHGDVREGGVHPPHGPSKDERGPMQTDVNVRGSGGEEASSLKERPPEGVVHQQMTQATARRAESETRVTRPEEFHDAQEDVVIDVEHVVRRRRSSRLAGDGP
jgi:hypothetical protein